MNNSEQAKKGFQTFVLTLSVSLILFSIIYYLVTSISDSDSHVGIDADYKSEAVITKETPEVAGTSDYQDDTSEPSSESAEDTPSAFGKLAALTQETLQDDAQKPTVLAGAAVVPNPTAETEPETVVEDLVVVPETTETTSVPETGSIGITLGLIASMTVFLVCIWYITRSKESARSRFEKSFF